MSEAEGIDALVLNLLLMKLDGWIVMFLLNTFQIAFRVGLMLDFATACLCINSLYFIFLSFSRFIVDWPRWYFPIAHFLHIVLIVSFVFVHINFEY